MYHNTNLDRIGYVSELGKLERETEAVCLY